MSFDITATRAGLIQALAAVTPALAAKGGSPVLKLAKLEADGDTLAVSATDNEIGVRFALVGVAVRRPGAVLVDPGRLADVLAKSAGDATDLRGDPEDGSLSGKTFRGRFTLPGGRVAEFPDVAGFNADAYWTLSAKAVGAMVRRAAFAAGESAKEHLATSGPQLELSGPTARMTATDTKIIASLTVAADPSATGLPAAAGILPPKALKALQSTLGDAAEPVRVTLRPNTAVFGTERAVVHTVLIGGTFPNFIKFLPKPKYTVAVPVRPLRALIEEAAAVADPVLRKVRVRFRDGQVTAAAAGVGVGSGESTMVLAAYDGPDVLTAWDYGKVLDLLKAAPADPLTLELTAGDKTAVFRSDGWFGAIAPMNIDDPAPAKKTA